MQEPKFGYDILKRIIEQLDESETTDFDYEQSDIIKTLFEGETLKLPNFKERIASEPKHDNHLFHQMRKKIFNKKQ